MAAFYIFIILLCRVVQAVFSKRSSIEIKNIPMLVGYTAFQNSVSAILGLLLILFASTGFKIDFLTVVIACFSGISLFASGFCSITGMKYGTVSLVSMFGTAGMLIPFIAGIILFDQPINALQWFGVALFFVSAWLLIKSSKQTYKNINFKTFLLFIGVMISNGSTMLAQQMFTKYVPEGDISVFSFISFALTFLLGTITFLILKHKKSFKAQNTEIKFPKILIICGVALAIAVFIINQLATISTTLVSPVVLFTFINGGGTIISAIVAAILYKEKLTVKTIMGVIIGIVSLVIIKIF